MAGDPTSDDVKTVTVALELVDKPPRRNPWRPTVLTVRKFLKICRLVEKGFAITRACEVECISYGRFRARVSRSERLQARLKNAEETRFNRRHEDALEAIMAAGEKSWLAHAWLLERTLPHLYALRVVPRDSGEDKVTEEEIPAEILAKHRKLMLEMAKEDETRAMEQARAVSSPLQDTAFA
jgi:hypothetical protein